MGAAEEPRTNTLGWDIPAVLSLENAQEPVCGSAEVSGLGIWGFWGLGAGLGVKGFAVQELGAEGFRVCIGLSCFGMTT